VQPGRPFFNHPGLYNLVIDFLWGEDGIAIKNTADFTNEVMPISMIALAATTVSISK